MFSGNSEDHGLFVIQIGSRTQALSKYVCYTYSENQFYYNKMYEEMFVYFYCLCILFLYLLCCGFQLIALEHYIPYPYLSYPRILLIKDI